MLRKRGLDALELTFYENRLRRTQRGGEAMPTLMEATWDGWFDEHDARVSTQARTQGMTQGRKRDLAKGGSRMPRDWVLECKTGDEPLARVDGLRTPPGV